MQSRNEHGGSAIAAKDGNLAYQGELKRDCLSYTEVLAQSVSVIAPSTVPTAIVGLIFATAGNGTWLSFLLGMVGMVLVGLNINQFARRSASPGSLYSYIVKGLGPTAGVLGGWALLFGYVLTGMSTLCGFAIFANVLLEPWGLSVPVPLSFAIGAILACYVAFRDIQLSAKAMLVIEFTVLAAIMLLGFAIWWERGFAIDTAQLSLSGVTPSGVLMGVVLVVFGFSGFESSTSLGYEAKNPLRNIPRSVIQSTVMSGLFFIFMSYVVVMGFQDIGASLKNTEAPLDVLARESGYGFVSGLINVGILLSFFACTLACVNSTARIIFSMARHGLMSGVLGEAHETNKTPYTAVFLAALITFLLPFSFYLAGIGAFEAQGHFGTLCSYGFMTTYIMISIAAPMYLKSIGALSGRAIAYSVAAIAFMMLPVLGTVGIPGSELFPPPGFPENLLFLVFVVYMAVGLGWMMLHKVRYPDSLAEMRSAIDEIGLTPAAVPVSSVNVKRARD